MGAEGPKADLHRYLRVGREALLWKLEGLGEYDVRRPLVPTGTNLLGLVKYLAMVEAGYFGLAFDRPLPGWIPWWEVEDREDDEDLWARPDESRGEIVSFYRRVWQHADIVRELIDGSAGLRQDNDNMAGRDSAWWAERRERLEQAAREAAGAEE